MDSPLPMVSDAMIAPGPKYRRAVATPTRRLRRAAGASGSRSTGSVARLVSDVAMSITQIV